MCARNSLRHQVLPQLIRLADRRRQPDRRESRAQPVQPCQRQRQQIAALRGHQRVQFVEHHAAQSRKERLRLAMGDQQRQLLGRGQQDVGRPADLAGALVGRRVARAGLDPHGQSHLGDGRVEVAGDVDRQRLQRRDVEGVEPGRLQLLRPTLREGDEARQEARERLAGARRRHQQGRATRPGDPQEVELVRPGRPAARREPGPERLRQDLGRNAQASAIRKRSISSRARSLIGLG